MLQEPLPKTWNQDTFDRVHGAISVLSYLKALSEQGVGLEAMRLGVVSYHTNLIGFDRRIGVSIDPVGWRFALEAFVDDMTDAAYRVDFRKVQ